MKDYYKKFLGDDIELSSYDQSKVVVLPFGYEGGVSYGKGTAEGPDAILDASSQLELYDEVIKAEPYKIGIYTVEPPAIPDTPEEMVETLYQFVQPILSKDKLVALVGGDHSITLGYYKALLKKHGRLSVIQLDAHADLRHEYLGSPLSHACIMSRIREFTSDTLQIGIRSLSYEESKRIQPERINLCTMHDYRTKHFDIDAAIKQLPDPVFITFDVDVMDWSVIRSTGTPEPGGFTWDECLSLLNKIFTRKNVVGFDLVEYAYDPADVNSAFAAAKLLYKMITYKFF